MSVEQTIETYRELFEIIIIKVWKMTMEHIINDFRFNIKDKGHFCKMVR
jgi:hypothetical protein